VEIALCCRCCRARDPDAIGTLKLEVAEADESSWVVSSASDGDMRLVVASPAPWPDALFQAAALVELLDERHRADLPESQAIADRLDAALAALRAEGIRAWLTS